MPTYGMTAAGFQRKTLAVCQEELEAAFKASFGNDIKFQDSVWQIITGIMAEREGELWELGEALYNSQYTDTAEGSQLHNVVALTGHMPLEARKSQVVAAELEGDALTVIPAGSIVSVPATGARFLTLTEVILNGSGEGIVNLEAEEYGAVEAPAGQLTQIDTLISGWDSITNPDAAELGREDETDAALRARRLEDISNANASQADAIRTALLDVVGVTDVSVTSNNTDEEDDAGRPPHSFEVVVVGGDDDEIREAIWSCKPSGVATFGTETGYVEDSEGNTQEVNFSRGSSVTIYVAVVVTRNAAYPVDGDDQIKELIVAYGETLSAGDNVANFPLVDAISENAALLKGIDAVDVYQARTASPVVKTTIQIDPDEIPSIILANVAVT